MNLIAFEHIYHVLEKYNSDLLYHTLVLHDIAHSSSKMKAEEHRLYFDLATDTKYCLLWRTLAIGYIMFCIVKKIGGLKTRFNKMNFICMIIPFETARCLLIWAVLATHKLPRWRSGMTGPMKKWNDWPQWDWIQFWVGNFQVNSTDWWLKYVMLNSPWMNVTGSYWSWVNIGLGIGLVLSVCKKLPDPMFTKFYFTIWCH